MAANILLVVESAAPVSLFEATFHIPAAHTLREVRRELRKGPPGAVEREHEEYDGRGTLVAVYESWTCAESDRVTGFVKYSPTGWVLLRSGLPMPAWPPMGGGWPLPPRVMIALPMMRCDG